MAGNREKWRLCLAQNTTLLLFLQVDDLLLCSSEEAHHWYRKLFQLTQAFYLKIDVYPFIWCSWKTLWKRVCICRFPHYASTKMFVFGSYRRRNDHLKVPFKRKELGKACWFFPHQILQAWLASGVEFWNYLLPSLLRHCIFIMAKPVVAIWWLSPHRNPMFSMKYVLFSANQNKEWYRRKQTINLIFFFSIRYSKIYSKSLPVWFASSSFNEK